MKRLLVNLSVGLWVGTIYYLLLTPQWPLDFWVATVVMAACGSFIYDHLAAMRLRNTQAALAGVREGGKLVFLEADGVRHYALAPKHFTEEDIKSAFLQRLDLGDDTDLKVHRGVVGIVDQVPEGEGDVLVY